MHRRQGSGEAMGAALLLVGIVVGAGLVYLVGAPGHQTTVTETTTSVASSFASACNIDSLFSCDAIENSSTVLSTSTLLYSSTETYTVTTTSSITTTYTVTLTTTNSSGADISVPQSNFVAATWNSGSGSTLVVFNTGTTNAAVEEITLTYGGQTCYPKLVNTLPMTVEASSYVTMTLSAQTTGCTTTPSPGEQFTGELLVSYAADIPFTGTFE